MIQELTVNHHEHISDLPYEDVVASFMEVTGSVEEGYDSVASSAQTKEDFERIFKRREGSSGFMRFLTVDHGGWLSNFGKAPKAMMVVLGNPLIAITMIKHDIRVGLNVPVRIYIYEGADGRTRVAYDLPSTLMSGLDDAGRTQARRQVDRGRGNDLGRHRLNYLCPTTPSGIGSTQRAARCPPGSRVLSWSAGSTSGSPHKPEHDAALGPCIRRRSHGFHLTP
jgi:uncharacterized protein (DUF302 family)